ncbi:hypothetical protein AVEN_61598-1 [Araneus ventricosus]|uniref:CCHC-type domain-containing protein n=1 Tax=Araneus ventricosus TaxID=182803 RepID=A0A4Y2NKC9_ARAVE|nr:hypothetical protein AVEN_61598-1 [Araneus ventricosus]
MGFFVARSEPITNIDSLSQHVRFLILSLPDNGLLKFSPFAIEKTLKSIGGSPKTVKRLKSGDLLIETSSAVQTKSFLLAEKFLDHHLSVTIHRGLNSSRGVVSEDELVGSSEAEILKGLSSQGVIAVRRINIKREGTIIPTKHLILTFNTTKLPTTIKAGFLSCPVKPYIPNPLRCFNCQKFGHSKTACRGKLTCSKCSTVGHSCNDCTSSDIKYQNLQTYAKTVKTYLPQNIQPEKQATRIHCPTCCCQPVKPSKSPIKTSSPSSSTVFEKTQLPTTNQVTDKPQASGLRSTTASPRKLTSKTSENTKQLKKSEQWERAKESKAAKRARVLAEKRKQTSTSHKKESLSKEDFLKEPVKASNVDSDPPFNFHPTDEDDMSTSGTDDPPSSSRQEI